MATRIEERMRKWRKRTPFSGGSCLNDADAQECFHELRATLDAALALIFRSIPYFVVPGESASERIFRVRIKRSVIV